MKLLGTKLSPYSHRIEWALKFKGIKYEFQVEDLKNKSALLLELNPIYEKVPVLVHGEKVIFESLFILEYIDETWKDGNFILKKDPLERAYARFWANFFDEKLMVSATNALFSTGEEQTKKLESLAECLHLLEVEIERNDRDLFGGDRIGFLDIVFGWIYWFKFAEETAGLKVTSSDLYPALNSWLIKFINDPVIKENVPSSSELYRVCKMMHTKWLDKIGGEN